MDVVKSSNENLNDIIPYDPKYLPANIVLSANENTQDVSALLRQEIAKRIKATPMNRYPDPLCTQLRTMIAEANGLDEECVLVGNGGDELLFNIAHAWGGHGRNTIDLPPTFSVYSSNARILGTNCIEIPRLDDFSINETAVLERVAQGGIDYIIIASPNNPTGLQASEGFLLNLLDSTDALVVVDEAYFEFSHFSMRLHLANHKNLVILRTFSKAFSLAGVRLGYIFAHPDVVRELIKVRQPYSVNAISQAIGEEIFKNRAMFHKDIDILVQGREYLFEELRKLPGIIAYPSDANFILFNVEGASELWEQLYAKGILIRNLSNTPYLKNCLRVSVGTQQENEQFIKELKKIIFDRI